MTQLPRVARIAALALFVGVVAALVISYRANRHHTHRAGSLYPEYRLSRQLVSVTENIRHLKTQGDRPLFLLTAARKEVYSDGHHELKDVALEIYGDHGTPQGVVRAEHCIYDQAQGLVVFKNQVVATTWQDLSVQTERLVYDQTTGLIETDQPVEFKRDHIKGQSLGLEVRTRPGHEQVILKRDVKVTVQPESPPTRVARSETIQINSDSAYYLKSETAIHLVGHVMLSQATETLQADRMTAHFGKDRRLQEIAAEGRATMESRSERRTSHVQAESLKFAFDEQQRLRQALAREQATARVVEARQVREVRAPRIEAVFVPSGPTSSTITRIVGDNGRVTVRFSPITASGSGPAAERSLWELSASEDKTLTSDWVELSYRKEGRELSQAVASGGAVLVLIPKTTKPDADRKTIQADRMDIEFYDQENLVKAFRARGHVRVEFDPLEPDPQREKRTTTSQDLVAHIDRLTQEFTRLTQSGNFHFTQGERQAKSDSALYEADTRVIRLSGGEPVMWDSRGRLRAKRIAISMESGESIAEESVNTTYYNQEATNRTLPFEKAQSPVFVAADRAEIQSRLNLAIYSGRVRAWQDHNHITADRIELYGKERMMVAVGQVKSGFYHTPGKAADRSKSIPVFAQAQRMTYLDAQRLARYEGQAQLQRGSDRLSADRLTVFLKPDLNEIERAVAEDQVIVSEPGRRAFGDRAVYTAVDERVVLIGQPARVEDDRQHGTQKGPRLTYLLGDDKVIAGEDGGSQRVKSVRRIQ